MPKPRLPLTVTLSAILASLIFYGCAIGQSAVKQPSAGGAPVANTIDDIRIKIDTTKGEIEATLFASKVPMTVANFVNLIQNKFYDGIVFHRVIPDFMAQVGDPLSRFPQKKHMWGTGGPGYKFPDEIDPSLRHNRPGMFSMANSGPNTNGSQIFITHVATPHLDGKHAVFGTVTKGLDVVLALTKGDRIVKATVVDNPAALLQNQAEMVGKWNAILANN